MERLPPEGVDVGYPLKDCQWIAQLLEHGLLRSSFVPPAPARQHAQRRGPHALDNRSAASARRPNISATWLDTGEFARFQALPSANNLLAPLKSCRATVLRSATSSRKPAIASRSGSVRVLSSVRQWGTGPSVSRCLRI